MKITLKKIKYMASLSEETNCYSADLYVDGKRIGEVSNRGHGGPDEFHGDHEEYAKTDAWIAANHAPIAYSEDSSFPSSIEIVCGDLVNDHLAAKEIKKDLKKSVLFIIEGEDQIRVTSFKGVRTVSEPHIEYVSKKHPGARILNLMSFDEALTLYKAHT